MPIRFALVNPNTNAQTTVAMAGIARAAASEDVLFETFTAPFGVPLISHDLALAMAGDAVLALAPGLREGGFEGVIVAAFGDPGLAALRGQLDCPVTGIAEAGMMKAASGGRRFAVVSTTPGLRDAIDLTAARYGHDATYRGAEFTPGNPLDLMADPERLVEALAEACTRAINQRGAEAIVIGGGPLALAARALAPRFTVPIIEPVPEAVRLAMARAAVRNR